MNFISAVIKIACVCAVASSIHAQNTGRFLEISAEQAPLVGSVQFFGESGSPVASAISIPGERYFWTPIPSGAEKVTIENASRTSASVDLFKDQNTIVNINSLGVGQKMLSSVASTIQVAPDSQGWIYLGSLTSHSPDSEWNSLYILDPATGASPDKNAHFTYQSLENAITSGNGRFIVDFPLYLRSGAGASNQGSKIVRGGQIVQIKALKILGTAVWGEVIVDPSRV